MWWEWDCCMDGRACSVRSNKMYVGTKSSMCSYDRMNVRVCTTGLVSAVNASVCMYVCMCECIVDVYMYV